MLKTSVGLLNIFKDKASVQNSLTSEMKKDIAKFNQHLPLIRCLANQAMQERHWERVNSVCDASIHPDHTPLRLQAVLQKDFQENIDQLQEISQTASREYTIENILKSMSEAWLEIRVEITPFEDTGTYVVKGESIEEATLLLEDQLIQTQTMKGSSFAK